MKMLITGATGFVGSKVCMVLADQYGKDQIIALSSGKIEGIKTIPSLAYDFGKNYLIENGCGDVEVMIHIGAFIPKTAKDADDIKLTSENIKNTQKLLEASLPKLTRLIYISTSDVYGNCDEVITENTKTIPETMYGWSKLYCEQMVIRHCNQNGLLYEILRLGHVYGIGEEKYKKVMPVMVRNAIEGKDLNIYGDGKAIRSYIYIDDIATAIVNSIELQTNEIINLVGNEPVSINTLAAIIQEYSERNISIVHVPVDVKNINYIFDNTKMRRYLLQELVPLRIGLKREYDYMKRTIEP